MKVRGLNNRLYYLDLKKYIVRNDDIKKCSSHHRRCREMLKEMYPGYTICEEVKLPGSRDPSKKSVLFLDFFIPNLMMGVEVHGRQHYEYVPFFHKTYAEFLKSQARDGIKEEWCSLNSIDLYHLNYKDTTDEWRITLNS